MAPAETLKVDGPEASAAVIRQVLAGQKGPPRDVVILNAAAAIWLAGAAETLAVAAQRAATAIDSGQAARQLERLAAVSHGRPDPQLTGPRDRSS